MENKYIGLCQRKKVSLSKKSRIMLSPEYTLRLEYFGGLLYNRITHDLFALNESAADMLFLTQYSLSIEEITEALSKGVNEGKDSASSIIEFLDSLWIAGVIRKSEKHGNLNRALSILGKVRNFVNSLSYLSAPIEAFIHLTWSCNMRCGFCFVNAPRKLLRSQLALHEIKRTIDELAGMGVLELTITGGDPLLSPMFIEVAEYAKEKGLIVNATINSLLINENVVNELIENHINVQVPLHGPARELHDELTNTPGSFDKTLNAITLLVKAGVNVTVATTLQRANKDVILNMVPLIKSLGVNLWNITELKPVGRANFSMTIPLYERLGLLKELEEEAKKYGIRITAERAFWFINECFKDLRHILTTEEGHNLFTRCGARVGRYTEITPDGFVYPCDLSLGLGSNEFIAGDLRGQTFKEIWHSSPLLRKIRSIRKEDMHGKCRECHYFDICGGKCRVLAYKYYGDLYAPDPRCPYEPGCTSYDS